MICLQYSQRLTFPDNVYKKIKCINQTHWDRTKLSHCVLCLWFYPSGKTYLCFWNGSSLEDLPLLRPRYKQSSVKFKKVMITSIDSPAKRSMFQLDGIQVRIESKFTINFNICQKLFIVCKTLQMNPWIWLRLSIHE